MKSGFKHLLTCTCFLPQFRGKENVVFHQFPVFSVVEEDDKVIPKYAQCNNCGIIHYVTGICESTPVVGGRDESKAVVSKDDIRIGIPPNIADVLDSYDVDTATWEEVEFIIENKQWDRTVVLSAETNDGVREGKLLRITKTRPRVEGFSFSLFLE